LKEHSGIVFDIQHFSLHDGPGVRSTVFLKGCPLSCRWCGNPESQDTHPQLMFFPHLCAACGHCVETCPQQAMSLNASGLSFNPNRCIACGACVPNCLRNARSLSGKSMNIAEISEEVRQHWRIFQQSGGGVTVSGGEPLSQKDFVLALLRELHDEAGLHTCLDTCAKAPWPVLERLLPHLDFVLLDIKHLDDAKHRQWTGSGNADIIHNARNLAKSTVKVLVRLPLIPDFNDDDNSLFSFGNFLQETGLTRIEIMPYHTLGLSKYKALGKPYDLPTSAKPRLDEAIETFQKWGLDVAVHRY
jgi:pyruvate formate lyase activating enzyme